eukprot:GDKH01007709.1.p2 GENE.GDKH01007709.1~~GDKH01007709.1.p2  ORF type:complete len:67 (-),score=7.67 GDKH01007709.1:86-286(-)
MFQFDKLLRRILPHHLGENKARFEQVLCWFLANPKGERPWQTKALKKSDARRVKSLPVARLDHQPF